MPKQPVPRTLATALRRAMTHGFIAACVATLGSAAAAQVPPSPAAATPVKEVDVYDTVYKNVRMGSMTVPEGWIVENRSTWAYNLIYFPHRYHVAVYAPDGQAALFHYPVQSFTWASGALANTPRNRNAPNLGPTDASPGITAAQALYRGAIAPFRGQMPGLRVVGWRPVSPLPAAVANKQQGDSVAVRVQYSRGGTLMEEDFYGFLEKVYTISFTGPYGTSYEHHRFLRYTHSFAARQGSLDNWYPTLAFMHAQSKGDPRWAELHSKVYQGVNAQFSARMKQGWDSIRASGEASRMISANNDAMIASLRARATTSNTSREQINRGFSEYIRGVERVQDPATGRTHEVSSGSNHYWRSAQGTIVGTNSVGDPNVGSTTSWQRLESVR